MTPPNSKQTQKIPIAVSSCLLGELVRYDGGHKQSRFLAEDLNEEFSEKISEKFSEEFELISICPEVAVGLGTPREPIELTKTPTGVRAQGVHSKANLDPTDLLVNYAATVLTSHPSICGFIFKAKSPSCGLRNVDVFSQQGVKEEVSSGIYAKAISESRPELPMIEETELEVPERRDQFFAKARTLFLSDR